MTDTTSHIAISSIFPPSDWVETTLGEVIKIGRGSSPRPIQDFIVEKNGIPWVKIADATASNNRYIERTKEFIKEEGRSTTVLHGDLIVSNSATPGIPKFMKIEACVHDGWLVFSEYKNLDKLYLYYFFLDYRIRLEHSAFGTVFKNLTTEIVRNVPISLPPLPEQQAIASVLSAFDDKIELLREQNKTLEQTAQTIFQEWFGKYSVDDELPEGWRVGKLGEICEITSGKRPENISETKTELNQIPLLGATKIMGFVENYLFDGKTLIIGRVGTHGEVQRFNEKIFPSDNTLVIKSDDFVFVYHLLKSIDYVKMNRGAVQPLITQTDLKNYEIIIPSDEILQNFKEATNPIFEKIDQNNSQIQSLARSRDEFLPRLMRGEVRVEF